LYDLIAHVVVNVSAEGILPFLRSKVASIPNSKEIPLRQELRPVQKTIFVAREIFCLEQLGVLWKRIGV
jgi:hypothetical protein